MINIGVLGSTNGTDLKAVLDAADNKVIDASVNIVISNRKNAYILKRSAARGVKTSFNFNQRCNLSACFSEK